MISLTADLTPTGVKTAELIEQLGPDVVPRGAERGMLRGVKRVENHVITSKLTGQALSVRTGSMVRSVFSDVIHDSSGFPVGRIGYRAGLVDRYAAVQELGTVGAGGELPDITPKTRRALAVPLKAAKDNRGVPIFEGPRDPALRGKLFRVDRVGKPPLLARRVSEESEEIEPLFVLVKRVAIPPSRALRDGADEKMTEVARDVSDGIMTEARARGAS